MKASASDKLRAEAPLRTEQLPQKDRQKPPACSGRYGDGSREDVQVNIKQTLLLIKKKSDVCQYLDSTWRAGACMAAWDTPCWGCEAACLPSCSLHKGMSVIILSFATYPVFLLLALTSESECSLSSTDLSCSGSCRIQKTECSDCSCIQGPFAGSLLGRIRGGCTKGSIAHLGAWSITWLWVRGWVGAGVLSGGAVGMGMLGSSAKRVGVFFTSEVFVRCGEGGKATARWDCGSCEALFGGYKITSEGSSLVGLWLGYGPALLGMRLRERHACFPAPLKFFPKARGACRQGRYLVEHSHETTPLSPGSFAPEAWFLSCEVLT